MTLGKFNHKLKMCVSVCVYMHVYVCGERTFTF